MSTVQAVAKATPTLSVAELEALIRRVVQDEVPRVLEAWGFYEGPTIIEPGSPIDKDLTELLRMKEAGTLRLLTHAEVWGADSEQPIIEPGSPIHQDLLETLRMAEAGTLRILSREEALSAD